MLARLPGPRALGIGVWALVPWLNAGANLLLDTGGTSAVWEQSRALVILNYAALSLAIVITLWGSGRSPTAWRRFVRRPRRCSRATQRSGSVR